MNCDLELGRGLGTRMAGLFGVVVAAIFSAGLILMQMLMHARLIACRIHVWGVSLRKGG